MKESGGGHKLSLVSLIFLIFFEVTGAPTARRRGQRRRLKMTEAKAEYQATTVDTNYNFLTQDTNYNLERRELVVSLK
jgi:hypothetical protein